MIVKNLKQHTGGMERAAHEEGLGGWGNSVNGSGQKCLNRKRPQVIQSNRRGKGGPAGPQMRAEEACRALLEAMGMVESARSAPALGTAQLCVGGAVVMRPSLFPER